MSELKGQPLDESVYFKVHYSKNGGDWVSFQSEHASIESARAQKADMEKVYKHVAALFRIVRSTVKRDIVE